MHPAPDPLFLEFQLAVAGRYSLERELGRGGMGVVYLARDVRLDRPVAIKLLPPAMAAQPALRDRFLREARTAARLSHPYVVPIHAVEEAGDFVFYVMTFVDGETLADRVRARGPLPPNEVTRILREVAWALAYAHAQGVVHRDVKPANILLERGTGRAMVTDFGIARVVSRQGDTGEGELLGTPEYMSPEQAAGEPVDGRSDLYALGIVGYYASTGTLPFTGDARAVLAQHITSAPPPVSVARALPRGLSSAIDRCLQKDASARFPTGEALAEALDIPAERRTEVPVPIRVFLDRRRMGATLGFPAAAAAMLGGNLMALSQGGGDPARLVTLTGISVGVLLAAPLLVLYRLRKVMRHGYGAEDIAAGMRQLTERRREEFLYEFGGTPAPRERIGRVVALVALPTFAASAAGMMFGPESWEPTLGPVMALSGYAGVFSMIISQRWRRLRKGSNRWADFWQGKWGHLLTRLAGYGLTRRAIPEDRPTELGIAMNAESLYAELPKEVRKSVGDVPTVLRSLESHARAMRGRIAQLDESLSTARGAHRAPDVQLKLVSDLESAKTAAEGRLANVVTALETLRLNLLRLRAGAGGIESVTQDLASAQALGEDVERLLAGQREVQTVLGGGREGD